MHDLKNATPDAHLKIKKNARSKKRNIGCTSKNKIKKTQDLKMHI